jgi:DNA-binding LytR/AlgR family response regulator
MKILLIEDEQLAAEKMISLLSEVKPESNISGPIKSIEEGIKWFEENDEPDVIISDIMLQDGLSFDIFRLKKIKCPIIFTTAYDKFAIQAFEVNSVDYLLKPIDKSRLNDSLAKVKPIEDTQVTALDFRQLANLIQSNTPQYKSRFLVKVGTKIRAIPTTKIAYFYTQDKLSFLITHGKEKFPVDHSLEEIDTMLDPKEFFRINRKFIIHIDAVKEIHPYFKGRVKLQLLPEIDESIVISSDKTPSFKAWLDQ